MACYQIPLDFIPVGYRFHPTDEDLITGYLKVKIENEAIKYPFIHDTDIYQHNPQSLIRQKSCDMSAYSAGPDLPDMGLKQIRLASESPLYARSVCSVSPSPKSVPLPSFFSKKSQKDMVDIHSKQFNDSATRDLRRLLRIH